MRDAPTESCSVWGKNTNEHLGNGTTSLRTAPVQVAKLVGVAAMATGEAPSLAVLADATVWAWGLNTNGQVGDDYAALTPVRVWTLSGIVQVTTGRSHALALAGSGAALA